MMLEDQEDFALMFHQIVNRLLWPLSMYRLLIGKRRYGTPVSWVDSSVGK